MNGEDRYKIIRYFFEKGKPSKVVRTGLTLKEAQHHCSLDATVTVDWYDGMKKMRAKPKKAVRS